MDIGEGHDGNDDRRGNPIVSIYSGSNDGGLEGKSYVRGCGFGQMRIGSGVRNLVDDDDDDGSGSSVGTDAGDDDDQYDESLIAFCRSIRPSM